MKIGIITIHKVDNFGAELQSYALFNALQSKGYNTEIIDYLYLKHPDHIPEKISQPYSKFSIKDKLKFRIRKLAQKIIPIYKHQLFKLREERFHSFYKRINYSRTFNKMSDLYDYKFNYDVYITGSDQVWNPGTQTNLDPYFLLFAPENCKKISYASSFGVKSIPKNLVENYKRGLNNFNRLSSREVDGVSLIKEVTGKDATHVLDPTLLLNKKQWQEAAATYPLPNTNKDNKYILIYTAVDNDYVFKLAQYIKEKTGYLVYKVNKRHIDKTNNSVDLNICDAGPSEFVDLFLNASFVVTNSFHGTAFSINFEKPFYTILSNKVSNNSRQLSILNKLNLTNRIVFDDNDPKSFVNDLEVNFESANKLLLAEREASLDYLFSSIEK